MNHGSDTRKGAVGYEGLERTRYESLEQVRYESLEGERYVSLEGLSPSRLRRRQLSRASRGDRIGAR